MPKSSKHFKKVAGNNICQLCLRENSEDLFVGRLHSKSNINVHYYCLLFSSALPQAGHDNEGILGFLLKDIIAEIKRGTKLKCTYCKKTGATLGCVEKKCPRSYHLPCGLENSILAQFFGSFPTYCKDHRFYQDPLKWKEKTAKCSLCLEDIVPEVSSDTLYPPCCTNGWFHKICIQKQALSFGCHYFRCPLCNNEKEFKEEMEKFGVHIPEQDASWETEPGAFDDLYQNYSQCDADCCLCPEKRNWIEDDDDNSPWSLVVCQTCGSQGTHVRCSELKSARCKWICPSCRPTVEKLNSNCGKKRKSSSGSSAQPIRQRTGLRSQNPSSTSASARSLSEPSGHGRNVPDDSATTLNRLHHRNHREIQTHIPSHWFSQRSPKKQEEEEIIDVCSSSSSRSESPTPDTSEPSSSRKPVVIYRERHPSSSSTDLSDLEEKIRPQRPLSPTTDSGDNSDNCQSKQLSPRFRLKRPAPLGNSVDHHVSPQPVKKLYQTQTCANPFAGLLSESTLLPSPHMSAKIENIYLTKKSCGSLVFADPKEEDSDHTAMPVLTPYTQQKVHSSPETVITISDSDEQPDEKSESPLRAHCAGTTEVNCSSSSLDISLGERHESSTSSKENYLDQTISPGKEESKNFEKQVLRTDNRTAQASILNYLPSNCKQQFSPVRSPTKAKRHRTQPKQQFPSSLKITAFYHPQNKTYTLISESQFPSQDVDVKYPFT